MLVTARSIEYAARYGGTIARGKLTPEEVESEAALALVVAAGRYEAGRDVQFTSYAMWWVKVHIQEAIRRRSAIYVPRQKSADPTYIDAARAARKVRSIDAPDRETGRPYASLIPDRRGPSPLEFDEVETLRARLSLLPPDELAVVERRHGLGGRPAQTQAAIAREIGMTASQVNYAEMKAMKKLRAMYRDEPRPCLKRQESAP